MLDNRLDEVINLSNGAIEKMAEIRKLYMELDKELIRLCEFTTIGHRPLHISRNYLENSLFYAIKAISLQFEKYPKGSCHD